MTDKDIAEAILDHLAAWAADGRVHQALLPETLLLDGTLDSLALIELVTFVREAFYIPVPMHDVVPVNFGTVAALARYISAEQCSYPRLGALGPGAES